MTYLKDPKSGEPSVTLTAFMAGLVVALFKLVASGIVIAHISLGIFTGSDFATVVGSLGAIYVTRRHSDALTTPKGVKDDV